MTRADQLPLYVVSGDRSSQLITTEAVIAYAGSHAHLSQHDPVRMCSLVLVLLSLLQGLSGGAAVEATTLSTSGRAGVRRVLRKKSRRHLLAIVSHLTNNVDGLHPPRMHLTSASWAVSYKCMSISPTKISTTAISMMTSSSLMAPSELPAPINTHVCVVQGIAALCHALCPEHLQVLPAAT